MTQLREHRALSADVLRSEADAARFVSLVAAALAPGIEGSVGAIEWRRGETEGRDWTAEGWLADGTFIVVALSMNTRALSLSLDTASLRRPEEPPRWVGWALAGIGALGVGTGVALGSFWWGLGVAALVLALWVAGDVLQQVRADRRARERPLDGELWRARLDDALAAARGAVGSR